MKHNYYSGFIDESFNDGHHVFVFGSNEAGVHGAGAARTAKRQWQAKRGVGNGIQGRAYGIPTKDGKLNVLSLGRIRRYVDEFIAFAKTKPEKFFLITPIGTGLAGYDHSQIAPMFAGAPDNCVLPEVWRKHLECPTKVSQ